MSKLKQKQPITPTNCIFSLSLPLSPDDFLKNGPPPTQFSKKGDRLVGTVCIHLKIYEIIFASYCVFLLEHFDVF